MQDAGFGQGPQETVNSLAWPSALCPREVDRPRLEYGQDSGPGEWLAG